MGLGRKENSFTILYFLFVKLYTLSVKLCYGIVMDGPKKAVGREEESGCLPLWLGRSVLYSFDFLHAWLKLKEKNNFDSNSGNHANVNWMQHWFYFYLYVTTSHDLKGRFVSELSTAQAMTLITLFKKRGRKVPYSVFMVYFLCFILGESDNFPKSQIYWRFYPFLPWKLRIPSIFPNRLMLPLINPGKAQAQTMRKAHVTICVYTMRFIGASFLPFHMCMCIARNISVVWLKTHHLSLCCLRMDSPRGPKALPTGWVPWACINAPWHCRRYFH